MKDPRERLRLLAVSAALLAVEASDGLCTQDDAFISFRYARNLVRGLGLVYNPGERVEGYTNFLWTVLFAPVIGAGLDPAPVSASMGMVASALLLWAVWRAADRDWLAALFVAAFPGLSLEGVQGLETAFYAFLAAMAIRGGRGWAAWAGLAALTRPEGALLFAVLWAFRDGKARAAIHFAALFVPHLAFRIAWYGDVVPNTFHAKVGGISAWSGALYVLRAMATALPLAAAFAWGAPAALRDRAQRPLVVLVALHLAYVASVGGDFKGTGRFVIPVLPALALVAVRAVRSRPRLVPAAAALAVAFSLNGFWRMADFASSFRAQLIDRRVVGLALGAALPPGAGLAIHSAGIVPYFADRPTLDMWGLTDAHIARARVAAPGKDPGHQRQDYAYVMDRAPYAIVPEVSLYTEQPVDLGDPRVFGPEFLVRYQPVSIPAGARFVNVWRKRQE